MNAETYLLAGWGVARGLYQETKSSLASPDISEKVEAAGLIVGVGALALTLVAIRRGNRPDA